MLCLNDLEYMIINKYLQYNKKIVTMDAEDK